MHPSGVILHPGKDKAIRNRHHWIFSRAVASLPDGPDGAIWPVYSSEGSLLGSGYFNRKVGLMGRMVSFDATPPLEAIQNHLIQAIQLRQNLVASPETNSYRVVNGEGDLLPGLIVDRYNQLLALQISTLGMDLLRGTLVDLLQKLLKPLSIYEKSHTNSRREEGLSDSQGVIFGPSIPETEILENGLKFIVSLPEGQKTGFFLDHREMRLLVKGLAKGRRVLNCFAYTGGFSVYALAGGAISVDTVELSPFAMEGARRNIMLNGFQVEAKHFHVADVFDFLRRPELPYDLAILDPPAFAKRQHDVIAACRGYKEINRLAMQKLPKGSLLLTSSCSYFVNADLFQKVLFQAAVEAKRKVFIIGNHRLGLDHPINLCHPEGEYLKSFLLYLE